MVFKMKHEGPHEDRDHIRNVLSHAPTRNPHLGCPPARFPKSHQGSCIRQRDLGTNHPSRPAGDLWVQLLPAVGVKQREPHRDMNPQVPKPQDMQSPWEKYTGVTNFCRQQAGSSWDSFSGCWQGVLLECMANVRVTYRNSHVVFHLVCQHVHMHGREGEVGTKQTGSHIPETPSCCANRGWKPTAEMLKTHTLSW